MKKKYIIITASCLFILLAGVCYSCSYGKKHEQGVLYSSLGNELGAKEDRPLADSDKDIENNLDINNNLQGDMGQTTDIGQAVDIDMQNVVSIIYVHLCGAVEEPNVYQVEAGARLIDVIELAGGLTSDAAGDYINQAMLTEDGQRIYIPTKDELADLTLAEYVIGDNNVTTIKDVDIEASGKVNINTAGDTELMSLPGIGQAKAKAIIDYRRKYGDFKDITDLMDIPGIKEGLFGQIEELIIVK